MSSRGDTVTDLGGTKVATKAQGSLHSPPLRHSCRNCCRSQSEGTQAEDLKPLLCQALKCSPSRCDQRREQRLREVRPHAQVLIIPHPCPQGQQVTEELRSQKRQAATCRPCSTKPLSPWNGGTKGTGSARGGLRKLEPREALLGKLELCRPERGEIACCLHSSPRLSPQCLPVTI